MYVAPLVGAWIEIRTKDQNGDHPKVAPLVGAWIEIPEYIGTVNIRGSLPLWERGLKYG